MLVIDASVAIKWVKDEQGSATAELIPTMDVLAAPDLLVAELCNACWKAHRRGLMTAQQADAVPMLIARYVPAMRPTGGLALRAGAIARSLDHPVYDCFYVALAEREQAPLVTADQRLLARVTGTPWRALTLSLATFGAASP